MNGQKKYTPGEIKFAEGIKQRRGKYPSWYSPTPVPNYADSLKQLISRSEFNILTDRGTRQDTTVSKAYGYLGKQAKEKRALAARNKQTSEKPKTASELLREKKAQYTLEYSRLGERMPKDRLAEGRRLGAIPKKQEINYRDKIKKGYEEIHKIDKLLKGEPIKDIRGDIIGYENPVSEDVTKGLVEYQNQEADSIDTYREKLLPQVISNQTGVPVSELNDVKNITKDIFLQIEKEDIPSHIKDVDYYMSIRVLQELEKKYGKSRYDQDDWELIKKLAGIETK